MKHSMSINVGGRVLDTAPTTIKKPEPTAEEPKVSPDKAPTQKTKEK